MAQVVKRPTAFTQKSIKDTNLRLQAQIDGLKTDKAEMLAMKAQLAQLTALLAGTDLVAAK